MNSKIAMVKNERIKVSQNHRFLMTADGQPFFWLGDTAWELFHRLNRAEAEYYLETRRQQGFSVIQATILGEMNGLHVPNANGHVPLLGEDPTRPNEFYFRYVDELIRLAAGKGLYIGMLPTGGDKVNGDLWGVGPAVFNIENARVYGRFLGQRYRKDTNILWILGGNRPAGGYESLWTAMAEGISEGLDYKPFFTYHPWGGVCLPTQPWTGGTSSEWLHEAEWLDMNMWQTGHIMLDTPNWDMITSDYNRVPAKPVLDGEPNYEGNPIDPFLREWKPEYGRFTDYDVRKQAYRAVFAGACGHTYGNHSIWQFWTLQREPVLSPMVTWEDAIFAPGAAQMVHLKNLMLSRPYLNRIPAQEILIGEPKVPPVGNSDHYQPLRASHARATRSADGSYAMVYIPQAEQTITVDLGSLSGKVKAWWYDPRNGKSHNAGEYPNKGNVKFTTPIAGPDWVLLLDNNSKNFQPPHFS
jgi:hypothetical protein